MRDIKQAMPNLQIVGYGNPTIFVVENHTDGTVACHVRAGAYATEVPVQARSADDFRLKMLCETGHMGGFRMSWIEGRPFLGAGRLLIKRPVAAHVGLAAPYGNKPVDLASIDYSKGFGDAVVQNARLTATANLQKAAKAYAEAYGHVVPSARHAEQAAYARTNGEPKNGPFNGY